MTLYLLSRSREGFLTPMLCSSGPFLPFDGPPGTPRWRSPMDEKQKDSYNSAMANQSFLEIERKFLVKSPPENFREYPSGKISQTYLSKPGQPPVLRVRQYGNRFLLTVKKRSEKDPVVCDEVEIEIEEVQYAHLKAMGVGHCLEKRRYLIPWGDHTVELDIFEGEMAGLILAEIEFATREEAETISLPGWFGREVTGDLRYSNNSLSVKGLPDGT